jgi:hypothetical protein
MDARKLGFGLVTMAALVVPAAGTPLPRYGTFVYSSLCRDRMTSDLNGDRLVLVRLPFHEFGYMEGGDGGFFSTPLEDLKIEKGFISFRYKDQETNNSKIMKSVNSSISAEDVGLISYSGKPFRLPQLFKFTDRLPVCRR